LSHIRVPEREGSISLSPARPPQAAILSNHEQQVWWPGGPEDPNLLVMKVQPERAEMWDGPASSAAATLEFAKARLTGIKPDLGENRKVTVEID
jgi:hypothetical protein